MDEQEVVKQIRELQKKRTSLKEQDTVLVLKIMELKDYSYFMLRENVMGLFAILTIHGFIVTLKSELDNN